MVFAKIGSAASVGAVFDDADAVDVEAADDRPARSAGCEAGAGDAGLGEQEIAKLGGAWRRISSLGTTVTVAN